MVDQLAHNWWAIALRGLVAIIFGVLAFIWPGITLAVLVLFFGAYALVDGIFAIIAAVTHHNEGNHRWLLFFEGVAGIAAGILTFIWPGMTAFVLLYLIAAWAIITGILEILAAIRLRQEISGELLLIVGGIVSIVFGVVIALFPAAGALAVVWLIASYAVIFGLLLLFLAFRLRNYVHETQGPMMGTPA